MNWFNYIELIAIIVPSVFWVIKTRKSRRLEREHQALKNRVRETERTVSFSFECISRGLTTNFHIKMMVRDIDIFRVDNMFRSFFGGEYDNFWIFSTKFVAAIRDLLEWGSKVENLKIYLTQEDYDRARILLAKSNAPFGQLTMHIATGESFTEEQISEYIEGIEARTARLKVNQ